MRGGLARARRNPRHKLCQDLVRDARDHILLLNERRHVHEAGCHENRSADIATGPDDHIRLELLHDARGLHDTKQRLAGPLDIDGRKPALKAPDIDRRKGKAFLGDDVRLKASLRPHIKDFQSLYLLLYSSDQRHRRVDMPAGATA